MISSYERLIITMLASGLALIVSAIILRQDRYLALPLACSTPALTAALLAFYLATVRDPAHGMAILILPLATGWFWWRKRQTGRPDITQRTFILLQLFIGIVYLLAVWWQEH